MKDMITVYQEINKRRQSEEMGVNSLTMFAEAWGYQKRIIDEQQKKIDEALKILQEMKHNGAYRATYILKGKDND